MYCTDNNHFVDGRDGIPEFSSSSDCLSIIQSEDDLKSIRIISIGEEYNPYKHISDPRSSNLVLVLSSGHILTLELYVDLNSKYQIPGNLLRILKTYNFMKSTPLENIKDYQLNQIKCLIKIDEEAITPLKLKIPVVLKSSLLLTSSSSDSTIDPNDVFNHNKMVYRELEFVDNTLLLIDALKAALTWLGNNPYHNHRDANGQSFTSKLFHVFACY